MPSKNINFTKLEDKLVFNEFQKLKHKEIYANKLRDKHKNKYIKPSPPFSFTIPKEKSLIETIESDSFNELELDSDKPTINIFKTRNYSTYIDKLDLYASKIENNRNIHEDDIFLKTIEMDQFIKKLKAPEFFIDYIKYLKNRFYIYQLLIVYYDYINYAKTEQSFLPINDKSILTNKYNKALKTLSELNEYFDDNIIKSLDDIDYIINKIHCVSHNDYKQEHYKKWMVLLKKSGLSDTKSKAFLKYLEFDYELNSPK